MWLSINSEYMFCFVCRLKLDQVTAREGAVREIQLPQKYHVAMTSQMGDFVEKINKNTRCKNEECTGNKKTSKVLMELYAALSK